MRARSSGFRPTGAMGRDATRRSMERDVEVVLPELEDEEMNLLNGFGELENPRLRCGGMPQFSKTVPKSHFLAQTMKILIVAPNFCCGFVDNSPRPAK
ncbi:hypothetical protein Ddc_17447 [Ditylenchus destructor]|nr:hypothetical protein Ddc_17447 [Ditylenchus destructor]